MNSIHHNYLDSLIGLYVPKRIMSLEDIKRKRKDIVIKGSSLAIFESEIISSLKVSKRLFDEAKENEVKPSDEEPKHWFENEKVEVASVKENSEEHIEQKNEYIAEVYKKEL